MTTSKLKEILLQYKGVIPTDGSTPQKALITIDEARTAILKLVKGIVPEERAEGKILEKFYGEEWNMFREEILDRLEGL